MATMTAGQAAHAIGESIAALCGAARDEERAYRKDRVVQSIALIDIAIAANEEGRWDAFLVGVRALRRPLRVGVCALHRPTTVVWHRDDGEIMEARI